jgi:hypothetical protein
MLLQDVPCLLNAPSTKNASLAVTADLIVRNLYSLPAHEETVPPEHVMAAVIIPTAGLPNIAMMQNEQKVSTDILL